MMNTSSRGGLSGIRSAAITVAVAVSVVLSAAAGAADGSDPDDRDNLQIYVYDRMVHDDNIYRQPDGFTDLVDPAGRTIKGDDYVNSAGLGIDGRWPAGQQVFKLRLEGADNRFRDNDSLNNVSALGRAEWDWTLGKHFTGDLGADYDRNLVNFASSRVYQKDILETESYHGTIRYQIGPRWSIFAAGRHSEGTHSLEVRNYDNFKIDSGGGGIQFRTAADSKLTAEYRYTDARYPGDVLIAGLPFDRDYNERNTSLRWQHEFSPRWSIDAKGGYVDRNYLASEEGDFSGDVWHASLQWQPTIRTQVAFTAFRELQSYIDAESQYFVGTGGSIQPIWSPREKIQFALLLSYEDQEYLGSPLDPQLTDGRRDKVKLGELRITYSPRREWKIDANFRREERDSNRDFLAYDDNILGVGLRYTF
jgi:exopolysaccharide biosynthesis operon protein EpsL